MRLALIALIGSAFMFELPRDAHPAGVGHALQADGPWIDLPAGYIAPLDVPTAQDIQAMADLDGDTSITTAREGEMIALLMQVLGAAPLSN